MQEPSRYNTIYDLASLRLHPDGSRARQASADENDNFRLDKPGNRRAVFGPRRGWFARDAAGPMTMPSVIGPKLDLDSLKRRRNVVDEGVIDSGMGQKVETVEVGEGTVVEIEEGQIIEGGRREEEVERGRTMKRRNTIEMRSRRAKKRLRFREDDTFIGDLTEGLRGIQCDEDKGVAPPPSDLLKALHHYSAQFYKTRGTLFAPTKHQLKIAEDGEKEEEEGMKKEQKAEETSYFKGTRSHVNNSRPPTLEMSDTGLVNDERNYEDNGSSHCEGVDRTPSPASSPVLVTPTSTSSPGAMRNMYRVFEGSFLLGFGILTQEKTAQLLESKVPQETTDIPTTGEILSDESKIYPTPYLDGEYETSPFGGDDSRPDVLTTAEVDRWRFERVKPDKGDKSTATSTTKFDGLGDELLFGCDGEHGSQRELSGSSGMEIGMEMEFTVEDRALSEGTEDILQMRR